MLSWKWKLCRSTVLTRSRTEKCGVLLFSIFSILKIPTAVVTYISFENALDFTESLAVEHQSLLKETPVALGRLSPLDCRSLPSPCFRDSKWNPSWHLMQKIETPNILLPKLHQHRPQTAFLISLIFETSNHVPCRKFSREPKETNLWLIVDLDLCVGELEGGQTEPKKNKPRNHDGTGSSRREIKGDSLEIMMELDPVNGVQTGTSPKFNEQTRSSRGDREKQALKSSRNWIQ